VAIFQIFQQMILKKYHRNLLAEVTTLDAMVTMALIHGIHSPAGMSAHAEMPSVCQTCFIVPSLGCGYTISLYHGRNL